MSQNLVTLYFTPEQLGTVDELLAALEREFAGLIAMTPAQRRKIKRMGDKSEAFCRLALHGVAGNPQIVPPSLDVAAAQADLVALEQLRPRLHRLQRLTERAQDTEIALGSDIMACALQGYALLKVAGKNQGLEGLRRELGNRFTKSARASAAEPA